MRKIFVFLVLGIIGLSIVLVVGLINTTSAAANPESNPPEEKQDFSRGRSGYRVLPDSISENTILTAAATGTDLFGYTLSLITPPGWINAQTGTEISFSTRDDDYSAPISIGFNFPFYENKYSEIFVSTNGMITFGDENDAFENRDIPRDTLPNNYIAPFWDDLLFHNHSAAYYKSGIDGQGKYFVVEWYQVSRLDTQTDTLTFEVILRENGDILFQYQQLNGKLDESTVGIEDQEGIDGNIYIYNYSGLKTTDAVFFDYPSPDARAKIYPLYQGGFINHDREDLEFTIRNIGDLGSDTFELLLPSINPNWQVIFYDGEGNLLVDSNSNGSIDTGLLPQGSEKEVKLLVVAPEDAQVGDNIKVTLSVVSSKNSTKKAQATFSVAVPTAFAQAMQTGTLMRLHLAWRENQISAKASQDQFFGSNLTVQRLLNGNYLYSWERNNTVPNTSITYADIKYTILSDIGGILLSEHSLTDNSKVTERTEDRYLVSSVTPQNGLIGLTWVRSIYRVFGNETKSNHNIYFTIINQNGNVVLPTKNLTNNTAWRGLNDLNIPYYNSPRIATTDNQNFLITWTKNVKLSAVEDVSDIEFVIYNVAGTLVKPITMLTDCQPVGSAGTYFITPAVESMQQNRVIISYSKVNKINSNLSTSSLVYQVLNSDGTPYISETAIGNSAGGTTHDSIRLGGSVMLAWASSENGKVGYVLLDSENASVLSPTQYVTSPNLRDASSVSVAHDKSSRGIITWVDRNQSQYMYYLLVSSEGVKLTPEMVFLTADGYNSVNTNAYGNGLSSYEGSWQVLLPLTSR
jgi:hypothetical protein